MAFLSKQSFVRRNVHLYNLSEQKESNKKDLLPRKSSYHVRKMYLNQKVNYWLKRLFAYFQCIMFNIKKKIPLAVYNTHNKK